MLSHIERQIGLKAKESRQVILDLLNGFVGPAGPEMASAINSCELSVDP
jgi:hypothetical protein